MPKERITPKRECPVCRQMICVYQFDKHVGTKACLEMKTWKEKQEQKNETRR